MIATVRKSCSDPLLDTMYNRLIVHAAANAQRAVDLIMGTTFEDEAGSSQETEEEAAAGASFDSCSSAA